MSRAYMYWFKSIKSLIPSRSHLFSNWVSLLRLFCGFNSTSLLCQWGDFAILYSKVVLLMTFFGANSITINDLSNTWQFVTCSSRVQTTYSLDLWTPVLGFNYLESPLHQMKMFFIVISSKTLRLLNTIQSQPSNLPNALKS